MTKEQALRVRALASVGTPAEDIAEKLGLGLWEVIDKIEENNYPIRRRKMAKRVTPEEEVRIKNLFVEGKSVGEIARLTGRSAETVMKYLPRTKKEPAPAATETSSKQSFTTLNDTTIPAESQAPGELLEQLSAANARIAELEGCINLVRRGLLEIYNRADENGQKLWELGELFCRLGGA